MRASVPYEGMNICIGDIDRHSGSSCLSPTHPNTKELASDEALRYMCAGERKERKGQGTRYQGTTWGNCGQTNYTSGFDTKHQSSDSHWQYKLDLAACVCETSIDSQLSLCNTNRHVDHGLQDLGSPARSGSQSQQAPGEQAQEQGRSPRQLPGQGRSFCTRRTCPWHVAGRA